MATIKWHARAVTDLDRLREFLFAKNPVTAARAVKAIIQGTTLLEKTPNLGRPMADGSKRRELFMPFGAGSYVLRYFIREETVVIVRVWHSREDGS
jgi:toxin ParE1/3/4